jgi:hypothetical protein
MPVRLMINVASPGADSIRHPGQYGISESPLPV